jgi:Protein of unknown function (DUF3300)
MKPETLHRSRGPDFWHTLVAALVLLWMVAAPVHAQDSFRDEELDQMLAPIALYPDSLLSQVLMAATYPADVAEAAAWSKQHPDSKGDAAVKLVQDRDWEPSVQSLVAFPQVLVMMSARPDDVQRLGDAFLEDPGRVMDRVQVLRKKAQDAGNLKSNEQQKVAVQTEASKQVIVIEPAQPQTVYVPVYQPTVVYGSWPYPSYPPYYWAPPPYYYPPGGAFVAGVFWGAAIVGISNSLWGGFGWGNNDVNINVNRYNNINVNNKISAGNTNFNHNPASRKDVPYRGAKSQEKYGKQDLAGAKDREAYRGKDGRDAERARANETLKSRGADPAAGREKLQGADRDKAAAAVGGGRDSASAGNRKADQGGAGAGTSMADRGGAGAGTSMADRGGSGAGNSQRQSGALSGVSDSSAARANADRGQSSRQAMGSQAGGSARSAPASRPAPSRGGGGGRR